MKHRSNKNRLAIKKELAVFKEIWEERPHHCAECGMLIMNPGSVNFSHYLSKGSNPTIRHEKANIDILCLGHHNQWEFGDRKSMKIYDEERIISLKRLSHEKSKSTAQSR